MNPPAILALENGSIFKGISIGAEGTSVGELSFHTTLTGYQEVLSDPSSYGKLVTLTYPHIGSAGVNSEDLESDSMQAAGLIMRSLPLLESNFRSQKSLSTWLQEQNKVAISEVDTRRLTRIIREAGSMKACILAGAAAATEAGQQEALAKAKQAPSLAGSNFLEQVTSSQAYSWQEGNWELGQGFSPAPSQPKYKVVVVDYGVKRNFLRQLVSLGCQVEVVPASTSAADILALNPQGIFLSNGPGDPRACTAQISCVEDLLAANLPMFGVGLGMQLLALAAGAQVEQLKFGQQGANQPVQNLATQKIMLTNQNHNFAVSSAKLPASLEVTHKPLFDGGLQGFKLAEKPVIAFQGHPTSSTEPEGSALWFQKFVDLLAS